MLPRTLWCAAAIALAAICAHAQPGSCPRYTPGSVISAPEDLHSTNGVLTVDLTYRTEVDATGRTRFCFVTDKGAQSPTLHVHPGDQLIVNLKNALPKSAAGIEAMPGMSVSNASAACTPGAIMTTSSVNLHYHGANVPPVCHQDEVITTVVNTGGTYQYDLQFPFDEPPGLYWYHPHIHGLAEAAVQGGASGAIIVDGIENENSEVAGLPERVLVIRDYPVPGNPPPEGAPAWNLTLNYTPIPFPKYIAPVIPIRPKEKQFWRVLNASADTIIQLQVVYDGAAQTLRIVARDGVPTDSQDGTTRGSSIPQQSIRIPPAGRVEFILLGPALSVNSAMLMTEAVDTGPRAITIRLVRWRLFAPVQMLRSLRPCRWFPRNPSRGALRAWRPQSRQRHGSSTFQNWFLAVPTMGTSRWSFLSPWTGRLRKYSIPTILRRS